MGLSTDRNRLIVTITVLLSFFEKSTKWPPLFFFFLERPSKGLVVGEEWGRQLF